MVYLCRIDRMEMMRAIFRYKGGEGSGFTNEAGHRGIPGQVGGSSSEGGDIGALGTRMPTSYNKKNIGEILGRARSNLLTTSPNGQQSLPKSGVTREQLQNHFEMVRLYKLATSTKYAYQLPGETVADYIDKNFVGKGFTEIVKDKNQYILHKLGKPAERVLIRDKEGIAYVKLLEMLK